MSFVTDQKAIEYLNSFPKTEKLDLSKKFHGASKDTIDFLNKILVFNPYFRLSLKDALSHPLFDNIRKEGAEEIVGNPVTLSFENKELDRTSLRELYNKEIGKYHTA